jgi:hypothetical protein
MKFDLPTFLIKIVKSKQYKQMTIIGAVRYKKRLLYFLSSIKIEVEFCYQLKLHRTEEHTFDLLLTKENENKKIYQNEKWCSTFDGLDHLYLNSKRAFC